MAISQYNRFQKKQTLWLTLWNNALTWIKSWSTKFAEQFDQIELKIKQPTDRNLGDPFRGYLKWAIIIMIMIIIYFENIHFLYAKQRLDVCPYEVPQHTPEYCPFRLQVFRPRQISELMKVKRLQLSIITIWSCRDEYNLIDPHKLCKGIGWKHL